MSKNIAIVADSSISFTKEEIEQYDVYILPNIIMQGEKTFLDQETISHEEVNELLQKNKTLTTSHPILGDIVETLQAIQEKNYDHIFILSVSKHLSGAYNTLVQALEIAELENYSLLDTRSAAGPAQQAVRAIRKMNAHDASMEKIINYLNFLFINQTTYIYPKSLDYIVKSGRVSETKATIVSLFKIRVVLYLQKYGESIEELGIGRTDQRIYDLIIEDFKANQVTPEYYDLYLSENMAKEKVQDFTKYLFEKMGVFNYHIIQLPAILSTHTGPETLGIQWCPKIPD